MQIKLKFEKEKDTSNTTKFKEVVEGDKRPTVGSVYILHASMGNKRNAEKMELTIDLK